MAIRNSVNKTLFTLPFLRESSPAEDEEKVVTQEDSIAGKVGVFCKKCRKDYVIGRNEFKCPQCGAAGKDLKWDMSEAANEAVASLTKKFGVTEDTKEYFVGAYVTKDNKYSCRITRQGSALFAPVKLTVFDKKTKAVIASKTYPLLGAAKRDWQIICQHSAAERSPASIKWVMNGETEEESDPYEVAVVRNGKTLWTIDVEDLSWAETWKKSAPVKRFLQQDPGTTVVVRDKRTKKPIKMKEESTDGAAAKPPTEVDRMRTRQAQEKIALQQRQANELMAAKLRDVQQKSREQQMKATAPKSAAKPART